jgi:hypothetical protein
MNKTVREAPKIGPCAEHSRLTQASTQLTPPRTALPVR